MAHCSRSEVTRLVQPAWTKNGPKTKKGARSGAPSFAPSPYLSTDGVGFEPTVRYERTQAFQACALNHSATRPTADKLTRRRNLTNPGPLPAAFAYLASCSAVRRQGLTGLALFSEPRASANVARSEASMLATML